MTFGRHKGRSANKYLLLELEKQMFNPYFHHIICDRLVQHVKSLRYRTEQTEYVLEIENCIKSIHDIYQGKPIPSTVLESFTELFYETVLTLEKVQDCDYQVMTQTINLLIKHCKDNTLVKVLISLQILIENDPNDQISQMLAPSTWTLLQTLLNSPDPVIAQNARDVLIYFIISSQEIPFSFTYNTPKTLE